MYPVLPCVQEALLCLRDLQSPQHMPVAVMAIVNLVLERKDADCEDIGKLLVQALTSNVLTMDHVMEG